MENNTKEFLELVKQNPGLPILPMVYYEVCCEDYGYWCGSWRSCRVDEYVLFPMRGEARYFTREEQDEIEEYLSNDLCDLEEYINLSDKEYKKIIHDMAESLLWKKAIIIYIDLPEV